MHAKGWALVRERPLTLSPRQDLYVGYVKSTHISPDITAETALTKTAYISALAAPVFVKPDIKSHILMALPMNSCLQVSSRDENFASIFGEGPKLKGYVHLKHIRKATDMPQDYVSVAEQFLGRPYIWGGTGAIGVDCSGLVQMSLCAVGVDTPRDADQQELRLGEDIDIKDSGEGKFKRGDLIFWAGHVGIMQNGRDLLHANAFHMITASEPLSVAIKRIGPPRRAKRLY